MNIGALIVDAGAAILPFVPSGAGWLARGGRAAAKVVDHADDVADAAKVVEALVKTGARAGEHGDDIWRWTTGAKKACERILQNGDDIAAIAKNTNLPEARIQRIKQHLFEKVHNLGEGRIDRFDPDPDIADAWDRLTRGDFTDNGLRLLDHEYFESRFEGIFGADYDTAHKRTIDSGRSWYPPE